jgi:hypothetical protein
MTKGWIKIHRSILDNPITCKDSDHFAIWSYLLLNATHSEKDFVFKGSKITLKSGQLITGRKSISKAFKCSESKVQRVLKALENEQQIEQQTSNANRLITILQWNKYQVDEQPNEQPVNNERTTSEQPVNTNKNVNNEENEKELKETKAFNEFWDLYDKKINPTKCKPKFLKLSDKDRKLIMEYIPKYKLSQPNKKFRKDPLTFLNNDGWLDEIITEQKEESKPFIYKY